EDCAGLHAGFGGGTFDGDVFAAVALGEFEDVNAQGALAGEESGGAADGCEVGRGPGRISEFAAGDARAFRGRKQSARNSYQEDGENSREKREISTRHAPPLSA